MEQGDAAGWKDPVLLWERPGEAAEPRWRGERKRWREGKIERRERNGLRDEESGRGSKEEEARK